MLVLSNLGCAAQQKYTHEQTFEVKQIEQFDEGYKITFVKSSNYVGTDCRIYCEWFSWEMTATTVFTNNMGLREGDRIKLQCLYDDLQFGFDDSSCKPLLETVEH